MFGDCVDGCGYQGKRDGEIWQSESLTDHRNVVS